MMHELRTPLTSLNVVTSVIMDEIDSEKSRSMSRHEGDQLEAATTGFLSLEHRQLSSHDKQMVSHENLTLLQYAVGQLKVV
jgi:signal transduction histidine kinase